jgi:polyphosphate kinase
MELVAHNTFRLTRDADLEVEEDEAEDLLEAIRSVLRRRRRGANPVRLEIDETMSDEVLELLRRELDLEESEVVVTPGLLDLGGLWSLVELDRPELKQEPWVPVTQPRLSNGEGPPDLFGVLRAGDVLVHHPYDSFASSVEAFVEQAARDPAVLAIKQTMYRTSAQESPIIRALIRAAELGKQVVALVELKARFDEEANITYARELEQAGVHVVHGVVGLKTHAKISLVVRRDRQLQPGHRQAVRGHRAADGRSGDRRRPHGPVQPTDRLQPPARLPDAAGRTALPAPPDDRADPRAGQARRPHRPED